METKSVNVVNETAEVIARTGADPVLFAVIVFVMLVGLSLVGWIIRNSEARAKDVMEDYQTRMSRQSESAREEMKEQRGAHEASLNRLSESFERSLEKVVASNEASIEKIVNRLDKVDERLTHVEFRLPRGNVGVQVNGPAVVQAEQTAEVAAEADKPSPRINRRRRKGETQ